LTLEIIVVDRQARTKTAATAAECGAPVIEIQKDSFSHSSARNLSAQAASGEYLLFTVQDAPLARGTASVS
jgi:glycosyltransferase involved in cell wall biosynthesis